METGAAITIISDSAGQLSAAGGEGGAGIGGGNGSDGGIVTIKGGTVTATGGNSGAGIDGGQNGAGGSIIIQGSAVVVANGTGSGDELGNVVYKGNGIGNGWSGSGTPTIIIKDNATVTANGAGIDGYSSSDAIYGNITVGGNAVVNARGYKYGNITSTQRALGGTLSSETDSTAKIFSNGFNNNVLSENFTSGLIFTNDTTVSLDGTITENNGASCLVYGNQTLALLRQYRRDTAANHSRAGLPAAADTGGVKKTVPATAQGCARLGRPLSGDALCHGRGYGPAAD